MRKTLAALLLLVTLALVFVIGHPGFSTAGNNGPCSSPYVATAGLRDANGDPIDALGPCATQAQVWAWQNSQ